MNLGSAAKAVTASFVAGFTAAISALADGRITSIEWTVIVGAFLVGLAAVWAVPNIPDAVRSYAKAGTAALIAGVASLGVALTDGGVSSAELLTILIALLTGFGLVGTVPNAAQSDPAEIEIPLDEDPDDVDYGPRQGDNEMLPVEPLPDPEG